MRTRQRTWVVYKMNLPGAAAGPNAVCEQDEWDEMERHRPGFHKLIQEGIANEALAEKLARSAPGGTALRADGAAR